MTDAMSYEEIVELAKDLGKGNVDLKIKVVSEFMKLLIQIWGQELNNRSEAEKRSVPGKRDSATYAQTKQYLKPLFKKLHNKSIQGDILDSLTTFVGHLLDRNYIFASNAFFKMAIDNAPVPICVKMDGTLILNDEMQGLKRLMANCQLFFPSDSSSWDEYGAFELEF